MLSINKTSTSAMTDLTICSSSVFYATVKKSVPRILQNSIQYFFHLSSFFIFFFIWKFILYLLTGIFFNFQFFFFSALPYFLTVKIFWFNFLNFLHFCFPFVISFNFFFLPPYISFSFSCHFFFISPFFLLSLPFYFILKCPLLPPLLAVYFIFSCLLSFLCHSFLISLFPFLSFLFSFSPFIHCFFLSF